MEKTAEMIATTDRRPGDRFGSGRVSKWTEAQTSMRPGAVV